MAFFKFNFLLLLFLITVSGCSDDSNKNRYTINYHDIHNTIKSFSITQNDSTILTIFFSYREILEYITYESILIINNKSIRFPIIKTEFNNRNLIVDTFKINDSLNFKVCSKNNFIPWISECNLAYLRIGIEYEYYNKILLKAWGDYLEYLKNKDTSQFIIEDNDILLYSSINELKKKLEIPKFLTFQNLKNPENKSSANLNFMPLYQNLNYLKIDTSLKYLNKIHFNSCMNIDYNSDSNRYLTFQYFWNDTDRIVMADYWFRKLKEIKLEDYTITKFKTDENNCVEVSVIFHKTGLYNMNITNVLPFKGVDMNSDDNNSPFMTFSTNDFMIKVLPEN